MGIEIKDEDRALLRAITLDTLEAIEAKYSGKDKGAEATRLKQALLTSGFAQKEYAEALDFNATERELAAISLDKAFA
ncbi:MAG: hypothetical protein WCN21_07010 [Comamonadaceae bacterium]